jgi:hypothetical protein
VIRTQIQLTEEQARALKILAATRRSSVAELVRQSVDSLIQSSGGIDMAAKRRRAIAAAGRFRSGQPDILTEHDRYLTEDYRA